MKKFFFEKTFFVAARASCVLANIQNTHSILRVNIAKNAHQNACEIAQIAKITEEYHLKSLAKSHNALNYLFRNAFSKVW